MGEHPLTARSHLGYSRSNTGAFLSLVGRQIGRYRILEQLGSGGMSVVYKGVDTALEREVAVKVLHPHLSQKEDSRKRLAREAKAVAKLHHPNILEVFDVSSDTEDAFLVTELIRGQTLRAYLDKERLHPPELAAMVVHELALALAHAHEEGVIHRDLKPENVMVREDGVLKLMDFGIAKVLDRDDRMTQTGALVGSPAHMAPEVIEGEEAGAAADVFSLGTMLYLFATGQLPFVGPNTTATLKRILDGAFDDPRQHSPAIGDGLAEIIARCLAREPEDRYPTARSLQESLAAYLAGLGIDRVSEELAAFFADPPSGRERLTARIGARLLERAQESRQQGRQGKALADLNQLLALQPDNEKARALLERMNRRRRRQRRIALAGALVAVSLAGVQWLHARRVHRPPTVARSQTPSRPATLRVAGLPASAKPAAMVPAAPAAASSPIPTPPRLSKADERLVRRELGLMPDQMIGNSPVKAPELPIRILVRPYGYIQLDDGPKSAQPLAAHALKASPGKHRVVISCDFCEDASETIDVEPGQANVFHLPAELKPAQLRFDYTPRDAKVTIDGVTRSVSESLTRPFEITSPRGTPTFQHVVSYEITRAGSRPEKKTVRIPAGQQTTLHGTLAPL